jgi:iron complex outermembrane recepter protein
LINQKNHMKKLLFIAILFVLCHAAYTQVTGKITDGIKGTPLVGATVTVKATGVRAVANTEGVFSINAKPGDVLIITNIGHKEFSITLGNEQTLDVLMEPLMVEIGQVVVLGSRRTGRVKSETAVPVDVVNISTASLPTARTDIGAILNYSAPSFNYNKQSGSDGADHVDLASLRGLGPDQTLVLLNGKRRHQTAFVAVFGTRGRGNSGTDFGAIPAAAIDRIEILRDGASAQYGSDAIAGVINLILKKDTKKLTGNIGYSGYLDGKYNTWEARKKNEYPYHGQLDGNAVNVGLNYGLPIGKNGGFINLSGQLISNGKTFRQALNNNLEEEDGLPVNPYRRANGDASLNNTGVFMNMEIPWAKHKNNSFYSFGGYNFKKSDAFAFTRSLESRPERFPNDENGNMVLVPGIMRFVAGGDVVYDPHIQTHIGDLSFATGIKGQTENKFSWDISNTVGNNDFHYYGDKTFNAGLGNKQTHFDDGGFNFFQNTANANFGKEFSNIAAGFNLAFGGEYRFERYQIYKGEAASYQNYDPDKATGAQGFPGFQAVDEIDAYRNVVGAYIDAEIDLTRNFLLDAAVRIENYSDFGFTSNYKLAARYKITPKFNIRGSVSTGFRAPSLAQINFSNTFTNVQGGIVSESKIAPNKSAIAKAAGIEDLTQEKSVNGSLGFTYKPVSELTVTIDGYYVQVKDRVVLSGYFSADDPSLDPVFTNTLKQLNVSNAQFFANAVNTTNKGIDVVVEYNKALRKQQYIKGLFTGNFQDMTIDKVNVPEKLNTTDELRATFLSEREKYFILASAPNTKFSFNLEYGINKFAIGSRITYFGKVTLLGYGDFSTPFFPVVPTDADETITVKDQYDYNGKFVTDIYASFKLSKNFNLFAGVDNVFNIHPDLSFAPGAKGWAFNNEPAGPFDAVQMGGNGLRAFMRIAFAF